LGNADRAQQERVRLVEAQATQEEKLTQLATQRTQLEDRLNAAKKAGQELDRARNDVARADAQLAEARLGIAQNQLQLKQQEVQAGRSSATTFGGFEEYQKAALPEIAQRFKAGGRNALAPEEWNLFAQAFPDQARQAQEREARADPRFGQARQELGLRPLEEAVAGQKQAQNDVNELVLQNAKANADAIAGAADRFTTELARLVVLEIANQTQGLEEKMRKQQGQAQGRGQ
jgi:hypothetical protein